MQRYSLHAASRTIAVAVIALLALLGATMPAQAKRPSVPAGQVLRVETGHASATVFGNLTVTEPAGDGFATAYPCNRPKPWASNLNFTAGETVSNFIAVRTDARGGFCLFTTTTAHFVFDQVAVTAANIVDNPSRKYDSRERQYADHKPGAFTPIHVSTNSPNSTVFGNLTITNPAGDGYATAYPCNAHPPLASNINFKAGETAAVFLAVRTNANGEFCVVSNVAADVVFDQVGATTSPLAQSPLRLIDTRQSVTAVPAGQILHVTTDVKSATVMGTLTITEPVADGFATVFPCDRPRPTASNINFTAGQTIANFVTVRTDAQGDFCVFVSQTAQVVFDKTSSGGQHELEADDPVRKVDSRSDDYQTEQEFEREHGVEPPHGK